MITRKHTHRSFFIPLVIFCAFSLSIPTSCTQKGVAVATASQGLIDLSSWTFLDTNSLSLDGEWIFYPGTLIEPGLDFNQGNKRYVQIPDEGLWNTLKTDNTKYSPYGFASWKLTFYLAEDTPSLALKIPELFSAGRIILNGKEIFTAGSVGTEPSSTKPNYKPTFIHIDTIAGPNELILHIANFAERRGGFNKSFLLGTEAAIRTQYIRSLAMDLIIFGSLLTIGLYHLCLFWIRRRDRSPLWFGIFCIIIAVRTLLYGERFLFTLLPTIPWEVFNRLDHLTFYAGIPIFAGYLITLFNRDIVKPVLYVYQGLGIVFSLFLFFPPAVFNKTVVIYELITAVYILYILLIIARAFLRKREGARTTLSGLLIFLGFGVNEILFNMGLISTFNSLAIGLVLFLFTQSILLAMRFTKAFDQSELLGETLLLTNDSLRRFIPEEFLRLLDRNEVSDLKLGDQVEHTMTILFSDIRQFTSIAEKLGSAQTFAFLNDYFGRVGKVIRAHGGFIDKYMGDGFMALFPHSPDDALQAATEIQKVVAEFNTSRQTVDAPPIEVGIGLNFGPLVLGTVGEKERMDTTVIADSVNLCSRLEGLSKLYGKGIIVPFEFLDRLENPDIYHWRYLGLVRVHGRKMPVEVVHIYDGLPEKEFQQFHTRKERFEDALHAYRNSEYERAMKSFRELANECPQDPAYFTFITQIHRLVASGLAEEWDGIESLPAK